MVGEKESKEKCDTCKLYKTEISVTVNKVVLEHMPVHLLIVHRCFCDAAGDLRNSDREHVASKASNSYSLALRGSVPTLLSPEPGRTASVRGRLITYRAL